MTLPWSIGGTVGPIVMAVDNGYLAASGVDVNLVPGNGSANVVTRVASGAFQFGIGDVTSIIKFNAQNPDKRVIALYSQIPSDLAIVTLKGRGITKPGDLRGRIIGAPVGDASYKLFSAFSAATGVTANDVKWEHMAPNVREAMLIRGNVDAITANQATSYFAMKSAGIRDEDMIFLRYSDFGIKLMGTGLMASESLIKAKPELVRTVVRAINRAWVESMANQGPAVDAALKREPLLKRNLELERLQYSIKATLSNPDVQNGGLGFYDDKSIAQGIEVVSDAEKLPSRIAVSELINMSFLPPRSERPAASLSGK
jgi:NitT/TauT family transport system substrate-binding protein